MFLALFINFLSSNYLLIILIVHNQSPYLSNIKYYFYGKLDL